MTAMKGVKHKLFIYEEENDDWEYSKFIYLPVRSAKGDKLYLSDMKKIYNVHTVALADKLDFVLCWIQLSDDDGDKENKPILVNGDGELMFG